MNTFFLETLYFENMLYNKADFNRVGPKNARIDADGGRA